jgi:phospholipid/cholesterol/gamma-HCH transport system permease protein
MRRYLDFIGNIGLFGLRAALRVLVPPFEFQMILRQIEAAGWRSLPLVLSSAFALGLVLALHTRTTLVQFGAEAKMAEVQSLAFFNEIGPLLAGLLMAGRVGAGIGAELANMRATEQIDAIEVLSIDSFKMLVIPRIIACAIALPILTVFMDVMGLAGGGTRDLRSIRPTLSVACFPRCELGRLRSPYPQDGHFRRCHRSDLLLPGLHHRRGR